MRGGAQHWAGHKRDSGLEFLEREAGCLGIGLDNMEKAPPERWAATLLLCTAFLCLQVAQWGMDAPERKFEEVGGILVPVECNAGNHLYPYLATVLTCGCIMMMIVVIIVVGSEIENFV